MVVADLLPARLEKALKVGADAVINSEDEDVVARLIELHGQVSRSGPTGRHRRLPRRRRCTGGRRHGAGRREARSQARSRRRPQGTGHQWTS